MSKGKALTYGQRVKVKGREYQYEGIFTADRPDLLRLRFVDANGWGGVVCAERKDVRVIAEHPVCLARRLKAAGIRAPRQTADTTPACYVKNYGPTSLERAAEAFFNELGAEDEGHEERLSRAAGEMLYLQRAARQARKPRRLSRSKASSEQTAAA